MCKFLYICKCISISLLVFHLIILSRRLIVKLYLKRSIASFEVLGKSEIVNVFDIHWDKHIRHSVSIDDFLEVLLGCLISVFLIIPNFYCWLVENLHNLIDIGHLSITLLISDESKQFELQLISCCPFSFEYSGAFQFQGE